jgi:hypothetical protein
LIEPAGAHQSSFKKSPVRPGFFVALVIQLAGASLAVCPRQRLSANDRSDLLNVI